MDQRFIEQLHERALAEAVDIPEAKLRGIDGAVQQLRSGKLRLARDIGEVLFDDLSAALDVIDAGVDAAEVRCRSELVIPDRGAGEVDDVGAFGDPFAAMVPDGEIDPIGRGHEGAAAASQRRDHVVHDAKKAQFREQQSVVGDVVEIVRAGGMIDGERLVRIFGHRLVADRLPCLEIDRVPKHGAHDLSGSQRDVSGGAERRDLRG